MRGLIRDCFEKSCVCTHVLAHFPRISIPIHGKSLDIHVGHSTHVEMAHVDIEDIGLTMKNYKNYIKMQKESMSKYLKETVANFAGSISWNL